MLQPSCHGTHLHKALTEDISLQTDWTYKIVRQPDNKTVVENLKETTFTDDQMTRIGRYTYVIYACNEYGETAANMPEAYVLGKAMTLPMSQDFSNMTYFENQWMAYDANKDAYSWTYTSEWDRCSLTDTTPCANTLLTPGIENYGNDADEWLISPPLELMPQRATRSE